MTSLSSSAAAAVTTAAVTAVQVVLFVMVTNYLDSFLQRHELGLLLVLELGLPLEHLLLLGVLPLFKLPRFQSVALELDLVRFGVVLLLCCWCIMWGGGGGGGGLLGCVGAGEGVGEVHKRGR
jgi:hypothetical protein